MGNELDSGSWWCHPAIAHDSMRIPYNQYGLPMDADWLAFETDSGFGNWCAPTEQRLSQHVGILSCVTLPPPPPGLERIANLDLDLPNGMPSAGSLLHDKGACKPCAHFYTKGCVNGTACNWCHLCPAEEKKRRRHEKNRQRQRKACVSAGVVGSPAPYTDAA